MAMAPYIYIAFDPEYSEGTVIGAWSIEWMMRRDLKAYFESTDFSSCDVWVIRIGNADLFGKVEDVDV